MKIGHLFVLDISHRFRDELLTGNMFSNSRSPINALPLWLQWRGQENHFLSLEGVKGAGMLMAMVKHVQIQGSYRSFAFPQCKQEHMGWFTGELLGSLQAATPTLKQKNKGIASSIAFVKENNAA